MLRWLCNRSQKISACTQLVLPVDDHLKFAKENWSCFTCFSNSYMIKRKSKVCFRVDSCRKKHHTIFHPPLDNTSGGLRSYQNYHHTADNHNAETSKTPNETESIIHTQIVPHKKAHPFPILAGPIWIEANTLIHYGSVKTLLGKDIAKRLNVEGTLQPLTVTSVLSRSDKTDWVSTFKSAPPHQPRKNCQSYLCDLYKQSRYRLKDMADQLTLATLTFYFIVDSFFQEMDHQLKLWRNYAGYWEGLLIVIKDKARVIDQNAQSF